MPTTTVARGLRRPSCKELSVFGRVYRCLFVINSHHYWRSDIFRAAVVLRRLDYCGEIELVGLKEVVYAGPDRICSKRSIDSVGSDGGEEALERRSPQAATAAKHVVVVVVEPVAIQHASHLCNRNGVLDHLVDGIPPIASRIPHSIWIFVRAVICNRTVTCQLG